VFTDDIDLKVGRNLSGERTEVANAEDPSRTVVATFTVQPGAQFPWHSHAGSVVVNIVEGALVYVGADDCVEREYPAGTAFVDLNPGDVHTAFNATDDVTVLVAMSFQRPRPAGCLSPRRRLRTAPSGGVQRAAGHRRPRPVPGGHGRTARTSFRMGTEPVDLMVASVPVICLGISPAGR
jgi:quercetin dioxygenase-like cupin family protein